MITTRHQPEPVAVALPSGFRVWLAGALVSQLGDATMLFALGWAAAAHGGSAAGLVLSAITLPRTALLLFGGAISDRWGAWRVLITGDAVMLLAAVVLALVSRAWGTPVGLLLAVGLVIGAVDAFYLPSLGSMPRRLVDGPQLARAVALRQSGSQLVTMVGAPIGGVIVAAAGFTAAAWADAATFVVVLGVLFTIRRHIELPGDRLRAPVLHDAIDGVRLAMSTPGLRAVLLLIAGAAGCILPVSSVLIPLLARRASWGPSAAGLLVGAQGVGAVLVMLMVAHWGMRSRPGRFAMVGLLTTAAGQCVLAVAPSVGVACVGAVFMGIGSGGFVSHLSPMLLSAAPRSHLSRVQALLALVQSLALLVTTSSLGEVAHAFRPEFAVLCCAGELLICVAAGFASQDIRRLRADNSGRGPSAESAPASGRC